MEIEDINEGIAILEFLRVVKVAHNKLGVQHGTKVVRDALNSDDWLEAIKKLEFDLE